MNIHEVIDRLKSMNVVITPRTLLNYEKMGLIPEARRGGLGYGKGKVTEYPDDTFFEAYASYQLLNGRIRTDPATLREVREHILAVLSNEKREYIEDEAIRPLSELWVFYNIRAKNGNDNHFVEYLRDDDDTSCAKCEITTY
jgi:hypothetical protein